MTARRAIQYRTPHHAGPLRVVALALGRGYAIVDESPNPAGGAPHCATRSHHTRDQHREWCQPRPHAPSCATCHPRTRYAWTRPRPNSGRPIAATTHSIDEARRMLALVASIEEEPRVRHRHV